MTTNKATRTAAKITRGQLAAASGISQYRIDRIERNADGISDADKKGYADALEKLLKLAAEQAKTQSAVKKQAAAKPNGTAKKTAAKPRKAAQPKSKPNEETAA